MAKSNGHHFTSPTPVSEQRGTAKPRRRDPLKQLTEKPPAPGSRAAEQIDKILRRQTWCIWPGCDKPKHDKLPICETHAKVATYYVENPELTALREQLEREQRSTDQLDSNNRAVNHGVTLDPDAATEGRIYIIKVDDLIKIGFTRQPRQRLRAYPPNAELLALFPGTRDLERQLHARFTFALRKGREWFRDADEIRTYVAQMTEAYGPPDPDVTDRYRDAHAAKQFPHIHRRAKRFAP